MKLNLSFQNVNDCDHCRHAHPLPLKNELRRQRPLQHNDAQQQQAAIYLKAAAVVIMRLASPQTDGQSGVCRQRWRRASAPSHPLPRLVSVCKVTCRARRRYQRGEAYTPGASVFSKSSTGMWPAAARFKCRVAGVRPTAQSSWARCYNLTLCQAK